MKAISEALSAYLHKEYGGAACTLDFSTDFECLVAIVLSAQTTDASVNRVTPALFSAYPTPNDLAEAPLEDVEDKIKSLGLYRAKARNIVALSKDLVSRFGGSVPHDRAALESLPGVGKKTAGVFLIERCGVPALPVDTHVKRVATRLSLAKPSDAPEDVERKLEKEFPKEDWAFLHHALIAFGRSTCLAKKPRCGSCGLSSVCPYFKRNSSTKGM
jgi:endonuclease-3